MAKIIKKGNHLEEKYYAIKQEQADKFVKSSWAFCIVVIASIMIYGATITVSVIANLF